MYTINGPLGLQTEAMKDPGYGNQQGIQWHTTHFIHQNHITGLMKIVLLCTKPIPTN